MTDYLIPSLIVLSLAVWRVANMLADTDQSGPGELMDWFRGVIGVKYADTNVPYWKPGSLAALVMCADCSSVWMGALAIVAFTLAPMLTIFVSLPFALSAVAMLLETWWRNKQ
jgi:hypothetical protein